MSSTDTVTIGTDTIESAGPEPSYPVALAIFLDGVATVAEPNPDEKLIWSCQCHHGQLPAMLATAKGRKVYATDSAPGNIGFLETLVSDYQSTRGPLHGLTYRCVPPNKSGLPERSASLVIAHQAHTLDLEPFYKEVRRVARPGAAIAIMAYGRPTLDDKVDEIIQRFYREVLEDYKTTHDRALGDGLASLPFPFTAVNFRPGPPTLLKARWSLDKLAKHISALPLVRRMEANRYFFPTGQFLSELRKAWGRIEKTRDITWRLVLRTGIVK